jgi:hypothetical protein
MQGGRHVTVVPGAFSRSRIFGRAISVSQLSQLSHYLSLSLSYWYSKFGTQTRLD